MKRTMILRNLRWALTMMNTSQPAKSILKCELGVKSIGKSGSKTGRMRKLRKTLLRNFEHSSACDDRKCRNFGLFFF